MSQQNARTVSAAIELWIQSNIQGLAIAKLVAKAQSEGRTEFTDEEWLSITGANDAARQQLVDAIADAKAEGP